MHCGCIQPWFACVQMWREQAGSPEFGMFTRGESCRSVARCNQVHCAGIHSAPTVNSCNGDWRFDSKRNCVLWTIDLIDASNSVGSMELVAEPGPVESFFPCTVGFTAKETLCKLDVPKCIDTRSQESCQFSCAKQLAVAKFEIEY